MDHAPPQDTQNCKGAVIRHRDDSVDMRPNDSSTSPTQIFMSRFGLSVWMPDGKRPTRRVRSPPRPKTWISSHYKPHRARDDHSFYKPRFHHHASSHLQPRALSHRKDHFQVSQRERDQEAEGSEQRESSPPKQNSTAGVLLPRSTSSRDKDKQLIVCQSLRNQSREKDHRLTKNNGEEGSGDGELHSSGSQANARDRAIERKRREIDEVYYQESEIIGRVVKMLVAKDPSLELAIQSSLRENLRDIGERCVEALKKFIEDYDSRKLSHPSDSQTSSLTP